MNVRANARTWPDGCLAVADHAVSIYYVLFSVEYSDREEATYALRKTSKTSLRGHVRGDAGSNREHVRVMGL